MATECETLNVPVAWKNGRFRVHERDGSPCYGSWGRIVQIIPAPPTLRAVYHDLHDKDKTCEYAVVCLALVEFCDGGREVRSFSVPFGMPADNEGLYEHNADQESSNFVGLRQAVDVE